jgi:hypothetical protein
MSLSEIGIVIHVRTDATGFATATTQAQVTDDTATTVSVDLSLRSLHRRQ